MTQAAQKAYDNLAKVSEFRPSHLNISYLTAAWKLMTGRRDQEAQEVRITVRHHAAANLCCDFPQWLKREADRYVRPI
jgi:hypothetical protein